MAEALLFLQFYSYFLIICISTFLAGYVLLAVLGILNCLPDFFAKLFFSMLTGVILIVFLISLVATKGKTISIAFIPLFIALYREYRKSGIQPGPPKYFFHLKLNPFKCILVLAGNLIVFLFFFLIFYRNDTAHFIVPTSGIPFYGAVAYHMLHTGQENYFHVLNTYSPDYRGVMPYHYFELWFDAAWASLLHINFSQCLFFLICPFFAYCYYLSIGSILYLLVGKYAAKYFIFPFVGLFSAGICFSFYNQIPFLHNMPMIALMLHPLFFEETKASILACFFSAFFILYLSGHSRISFILLFFLPVCSITVMPSVFGGFILFYILSTRFGFLDYKKHFSTLLICIVESLCIFLFYFLLPAPEASKSLINFQNAITGSFFITSLSGLKNVIGFFIAYLLITIVIYLPFLVINLKSLLQNLFLKNLFFLFATTSFCGILVSSLTFAESNNYQLFELSSFVFANLLIICMGVLQLHNEKSILLRAGTAAIIILAVVLALNEDAVFYHDFTTKPSYRYISGIDNLVKKYELQRGVSIITPDKNSGLSFPVTTFVGGMYIPFYFNESLMPVSISDFNYRSDDRYIFNKVILTQLLQGGIFYRFVQQQRRENRFRNIEQSQFDFTKKFNIDFAVISKNTILPALLQQQVISAISDSATGDRFVVLKRNN